MSDPPSAGVSSRFARLNPFSSKAASKHRGEDDDEDNGEEIDFSTAVAGGGHSTRPTDITQHQLRVSHALKSFLVAEGVLAEQDAGLGSDETTPAVHALLDKPHVRVPSELLDRSHPLPEYFVSSSHNTYLMAHQLYGTSSASAYETALIAGSRCVEIDAWDNADNADEPKVTHGYTLVSNIPFRAVCETIRDVVDREAAELGSDAAPIMLSLENHCGPQGQLRLVEIMKEVWGDRLLSQAIREKGHREQEGTGEHVTLAELRSKIVVIVEYHIPDEADDSDDTNSSSSSDDEDEPNEDKQARHDYRAKKQEAKAPATVIVPELAELGVYAQSVKPSDNSWYSPGQLRNGPHHHLINVSEVGLSAHMPDHSAEIARHNAQHLMRVFPKGTRISSKNLKPVKFWGLGAQICALNWQTFGASMQLNEALFAGTAGYVLKPAALRAGGDGVLGGRSKKTLRLRVAGATDVPLPAGRQAEEIKPYLTCSLVQPGGTGLVKRKTAAYRQHKLGFLHKGENPPTTEPVWDETLEWTYDDTELVFLRMLVKSDDSFAANPVFAVAAVRLLYVLSGWSFIRMLDLKGRETKCSILVNFEFVDAE